MNYLSLSLIFLQAVATKLDLPDELVGYFSLFLVREGVDGGLTCKSSQQLSKQSGIQGMKTSHLFLSLLIKSILHNTLLLII